MFPVDSIKGPVIVFRGVNGSVRKTLASVVVLPAYCLSRSSLVGDTHLTPSADTARHAEYLSLVTLPQHKFREAPCHLPSPKQCLRVPGRQGGLAYQSRVVIAAIATTTTTTTTYRQDRISRAKLSPVPLDQNDSHTFPCIASPDTP